MRGVRGDESEGDEGVRVRGVRGGESEGDEVVRG